MARSSPHFSQCPAAAPPSPCSSPSASVVSYSATPCMPASCSLLLLRSAGASLPLQSMPMLGKARVARSSHRSSLCPAAAHASSCRSPSASVVSYPSTHCMPASCRLLLLRSAGDSWPFLSMLRLGKARVARSSHRSSPRSSPCPRLSTWIAVVP